MNRHIAGVLRLTAYMLLTAVVASPGCFAQDQAEKDLAFAQGLYRQENYPLAADKFVAFVKAYPNHANISLALFRAGECLFRTSKYEEAQPYFERLTRQYPDSAEAEPGWLWLGDSHFQAKRYAEAADAYGTLLQKYPNSEFAGRAAYWQGESYYQRGQHQQAIAAYQLALTKKLSDQEAAYARYALAWSYLQLGQPDQASEYLQQVLTKHPTSPVAAECQYLLGEASKTRKDYPAALTAYQAVLTKYPSTKFAAYAQAGIAWCSFEQKAWEPALEAFRKVVTDYPGTPPAAEAQLRTADCLFHLQRFAEAAPIYEQVAAGKDSKWADEALYWLAVSYEQKPDSAKAIAAFTRLTSDFKQSPHLAEAYLHVAHLQSADGKADAAYVAYQRAIDCGTPEIKQQAAAGLAWARYQKDKSEPALAELERAVNQDPKSPTAADLGYRVAFAHFEAGRYQPALTMLQTLMTSQPALGKQVEVMYLAAACYDKLNQDAKAEELYLKVLKDSKQSEYTELCASGLVGLYARQGNLEQARNVVANLQKSGASPETRACALNAVADALTQAKQYAEGVRLYTKALETAPNSSAAPSAQLGLGWARLGAGDSTAADAFLAVLKSYPNSPAAKRVPEGLFAIGEALFDKGKYAEAQAAYQRLLDACPGSQMNAEAQYKIAWSLLKQEKPSASLPYFVQAANGTKLPAVAADARYQAGRLSYESGDFKQASALLEPFRQQYQDAEKTPNALILLGRADTELKLTDPAQQVFQLVLTRYPKQVAVPEAWLGLACLYRQQQATDKALDALGKCLATATGVTGAEAQYELAACYKQQGDTKRALEEFLKVAILYPDDHWGARAQYDAGQCSEQLKDTAGAIKAYQILVRDYPKQQQLVDQAQARLKDLQP